MASLVARRGVKIVRDFQFDWALGGPLLVMLTLGLSAGVFVGQRELKWTRGPHARLPVGDANAAVPPPPILGHTTPFHWLK
jgi:hypothetical protein